MNENIVFHEDTKKVKSFYKLVALLFYLGFFFGLNAIIIYRVIKPVQIINHYQPQGEDIIVTTICLIVSIIYLIAIARLSNYIQVLDITQNEVSLVFQNNIIKYKYTDLVDYRITQNRLLYIEVILRFNDDKSYSIISSKKMNLTNVLEIMLKVS